MYKVILILNLRNVAMGTSPWVQKDGTITSVLEFMGCFLLARPFKCISLFNPHKNTKINTTYSHLTEAEAYRN